MKKFLLSAVLFLASVFTSHAVPLTDLVFGDFSCAENGFEITVDYKHGIEVTASKGPAYFHVVFKPDQVGDLEYNRTTLTYCKARYSLDPIQVQGWSVRSTGRRYTLASFWVDFYGCGGGHFYTFDDPSYLDAFSTVSLY